MKNQKLICILLVSMFFIYLLPINYSNYMGQVLGFYAITLYDSIGGVHENFVIAEPGDTVNVPQDIEQSAVNYVSADNNWGEGSSQQFINTIWSDQEKTHDDDHWAYITIGSTKKYLVSLAPTYGLVGDYVDIYIVNEEVERIYPCIIADLKDIWVEEGYEWTDGTIYGNKEDEKCEVFEIMSELSEDFPDQRDDLVGVTKIINKGSIMDNLADLLDSNGIDMGESTEEGVETETQKGSIGSTIREFWVAIVTWCENSINQRNDVTSLYELKNTTTSTSNGEIINDGGDGVDTVYISIDGFYQYYQDDYAHVPYGDDSIREWGCGPTAFAMVASTIKGEQITPKDAVEWCGNKYYKSGVGTYWSYFRAANSHFNVPASITEAKDIEKVASALKEGSLVISSQKTGLFTTASGHFIVLAAITQDDKIVVRDPSKGNAVNKGYNNRLFTKKEISQNAKNYWIFKPN